MELTEQNYRERVAFIVKQHGDAGEPYDTLVARLKEKGVEYCIVLPLFEAVLEFDAIRDISMELGSQTYSDQRFDFVVKPSDSEHYSLLVEAKALSEESLKKHQEQIKLYMKSNQEYPWGILTNGYQWQFFLSKKYMEVKFNDGKPVKQMSSKDSVINVLNIDIHSEHFIELMKGMKYGSTSDFWYRIAKYAYMTMVGGKGNRPTVHGNRAINELMISQIREAVEIKSGEYLPAIESGAVNAVSKVVCKNDYLTIEFELDRGGRLILHPGKANTSDFLKFNSECPGGVRLLEEWSGSKTNNGRS